MLVFLVLLTAAAPTTERTSDDLMSEARSLYAELEYDRVGPLVAEVVSRDNVDIQTRLDAYMLQGSCLAILGDQIGAEKAFRFLLRGRPDYDLPPTTPPKILAVFRKVQVEEQAIRRQTRELELDRIKQTLQLDGSVPAKATGGYAIPFKYRLIDPKAAVTQLRLSYRREGDPGYASVPLQLAPDGAWQGSIPADQTESPKGIELEYVVQALDPEGDVLLQRGMFNDPLRIDVKAGTVAGAIPVYKQKWFWWLAGGVVAASIVTGVLIYEHHNALPNTDIGAYHVN